MQQSTLNEIKQNLLYILDEIHHKRQYLNKHFQNSMNNYFLENYATLTSLKKRFDTQSGRQVRKEVFEKYNSITQLGGNKGFLKCFLLMRGFTEEHKINNSLKEYRKSLIQMANNSTDDSIQKGSLEWVTIQWRRLFALMVLHYTYYPEISGVYELWNHIFDERLVSRERQKKKKEEISYKQGKAPYIICIGNQESKILSSQKQNEVMSFNEKSHSCITSDNEDKLSQCSSGKKSVSQIINNQNKICLAQITNKAEIKQNTIQDNYFNDDNVESYLTKKRITQDTIIVLRNNSNENQEISRNFSSQSSMNSMIENQQYEQNIEIKIQSVNFDNKISNLKSSQQFQNQLILNQGSFEASQQSQNQSQDQSYIAKQQFKNQHSIEQQNYLNKQQETQQLKYQQSNSNNQINYNHLNQINAISSLKYTEEKDQIVSNTSNQYYPQYQYQSGENGQQNTSNQFQLNEFNYLANCHQIQQRQLCNYNSEQQIQADYSSFQDKQNARNQYFEVNNRKNQIFYEQQQHSNLPVLRQIQNNVGIENQPDYYINCNQENYVSHINQNSNEDLNKQIENQVKSDQNSYICNNIEVNLNSQKYIKVNDQYNNQTNYNSIQQQQYQYNQPHNLHTNQQQTQPRLISNSYIHPQTEINQYNYDQYPQDISYSSSQDQQSVDNIAYHSQLSSPGIQPSKNFIMNYQNNYNNSQQNIQADQNGIYQHSNFQKHSMMNQYHDSNILCADPVLEIFSSQKNEYL